MIVKALFGKHVHLTFLKNFRKLPSGPKKRKNGNKSWRGDGVLMTYGLILPEYFFKNVLEP